MYRAIVTRCPSYEPDPENENKIQVCIPSYHGEVDNIKVGSGSNPGVYPWARMCFPILNSNSESSISDLASPIESTNTNSTISDSNISTNSIDTNNFKPRTTDDGLDGKYWTTDNPFYPSYGLPNCTCYAWGRVYEITGTKPNLPTGDAGTWVESLNGAYTVSKDSPQLGDVCCWKGGSDGGHVAVVEEILNNGETAVISESAWGGFRFNYGYQINKSNNWGYGSSYVLQGFIHIGDYKSSSSSVSLGDSSSEISINPYPSRNDVVWVTFEGGDIRYPIIVGSMTPPKISLSSYNDLDSSTLAKLASDIIIYEEVGPTKVYDSVIGDDNGGLSIGLLGFHEDNARSVAKEIYKINSSVVPLSISNKLNESWRSWTFGDNSPEYNAFKSMLITSASKEAQDKIVISYIEDYINAAKKLGITDNAALIYAADLHNQGGLGALEMCYDASAKPVTLDSLYKGSMSTYMGDYVTRRNRVYKKVKELQTSGKLNNLDNDIKDQASKTIAYAKKEVGYKASDHGGLTKYGQWYGPYMGCSSSSFAYEAWCAMFTQWCMYKAGVGRDQIFVTASAGTDGWSAKGLYHDKNGFTPKVGDIIVFGNGEHVGLVENYKNGIIYTIEGNTGTHPGCVATHKYEINNSYVTGFNRPKYK